MNRKEMNVKRGIVKFSLRSVSDPLPDKAMMRVLGGYNIVDMCPKDPISSQIYCWGTCPIIYNGMEFEGICALMPDPSGSGYLECRCI